jgi:hypothetical protein
MELVCVAYPLSSKHEGLGLTLKTGCMRIRIICPSGVTCLPADCWFNDLALSQSNYASKTDMAIIIISSICRLLSPWYSWKIGVKPHSLTHARARALTHSLTHSLTHKVLAYKSATFWLKCLYQARKWCLCELGVSILSHSTILL